MAENSDNIVLHGACRVTVGGTVLGHTTVEGCKATLSGDNVDIFTGKYGPNVPVKSHNPGRGIDVEFLLNETVMTALILAFPNWTRISGSGKEKIAVGNVSGAAIASAELILTSFISANTPGKDLTISKAVPSGNPEIVYVGNQEQRWAVKFKGLMNESTGYVFVYGDNSASAETDNADVTAVSPTGEAVAQNINTSVVWTLDRELDASTVNVNTVLLQEADATPAQIAGAVSLVNNGASTQITFNPTSDLTAATLHLATLTNQIKDVNGLAIDGYASRFTTA